MENRKLSRPHVWLPRKGATRTLLLLHGSGADEYDLLALGRQIDPSANIISPRGGITQQGMVRFFEYEPDFTPARESLLQEVEKLADFIELSSVRYEFSIGSMVTIGFSNGAHTGGALLLLRSDLVNVLVAFGTTQVLPEISSGVDLLGKQIFIANGELDGYSPEQKTIAMIRQLEGLGADVTLLIHPGGHQISGEHVEFIAKTLKS